MRSQERIIGAFVIVCLAAMAAGCGTNEKVEVSVSNVRTAGTLVPIVLMAGQGNTLWFGTLTVKNTSDVVPHHMCAANVSLVTADGQTFQALDVAEMTSSFDAIEMGGVTITQSDLTRLQFPDVQVEPGKEQRGLIIFEIPANAQPQKLIYTVAKGKPVEVDLQKSGAK